MSVLPRRSASPRKRGGDAADGDGIVRDGTTGVQSGVAMQDIRVT